MILVNRGNPDNTDESSRGHTLDLAHRLADYSLSLKLKDVDDATRHQAKGRIIDALGCAMGAFGVEPLTRVRKVASRVKSSRSSTLLGTRERTSPDLAAFVNGFMVRYFDYNDTYLSKEPAHPSDNISACLAVAEAVGSGGEELLASIVVAYELQCRLCDAAELRRRGWDHVNYGLVSTALASSRLMGSGVEMAAQSVNIALNSHIAMRQVRAGELSDWKGASFANAARNGVFAASLAREGLNGPAPIFEGEMGFFRQVSGPFRLNTASFGGSGRRFRLTDTYIKYWPAEYHSQSAVWAALDLRSRVSEITEIKSILIETHEAGYSILGKDREKWRPKTKETADHSLPFIVATALVEGSVTNESYTRARLRSRELLDIVDKTEVKEDPRLTRLYPARGIANRVTVTTRDGRRLSSQVVIPKGHPLNPMRDDEVEEKFARLTRKTLSASRRKKVLDVLWNIEEANEIGGIVSLLAIR